MSARVRVKFCGITRAEELCTISFAGNRRVYGQWQSQLPSRFIDELPAEHIEHLHRNPASRPDLGSFLDRVYYELRNAGKTSRERAINHAATNAFQVRDILSATHASGLQLASIDAEPNPLGRPGAECWDVTLKFFNPKDRLGQATLVHRFTVDVSGVLPVTIGEPRHWFAF